MRGRNIAMKLRSNQFLCRFGQIFQVANRADSSVASRPRTQCSLRDAARKARIASTRKPSVAEHDNSQGVVGAISSVMAWGSR
jgi:hypothetical protein